MKDYNKARQAVLDALKDGGLSPEEGLKVVSEVAIAIMGSLKMNQVTIISKFSDGSEHTLELKLESKNG